jgi:hypothetical protein
MTEKPQWRYLAGADAERLFETKTKMSDIEFEKLLHNLLAYDQSKYVYCMMEPFLQVLRYDFSKVVTRLISCWAGLKD